MNRHDVVTFDMGYTLVYFHPPEAELRLSAYRAVGLHPEPAALQQAHDLAWQGYVARAPDMTFEPTLDRNRQLEEEMARRTLEHLGLFQPSLVRPLLEASRTVFQTPGVLRMYPEVEDVLRTLCGQGCRLGIISNWGWNLEDLTARLGLRDYFGVVLASARAGCEKPHPAIFQQALQALASPPERAIHIGDSYEADVVGARGVGMGAIWLDRAGRGGHKECRAVRDLGQVLGIVRA